MVYFECPDNNDACLKLNKLSLYSPEQALRIP